MKRLAQLVCAMLIVVAVAIHCDRAHAQAGFDTRWLRSEAGWHGYGDGQTQAFMPSVDTQLPYVSVWERSVIGNQWGNWLYVRILFNCDKWEALPFSMLDENGNEQLVGDMIGRDPELQRPVRGEPLYKRLTAMCGQFGYIPPDKRPPAQYGFNHVERVDKP